MPDSRADQVWRSIMRYARNDATAPTVRHACLACKDAVGAVGVGMFMTRPSGQREPLTATDAAIAELEELQFTLGQGPATDVATNGRFVSAPDLSASTVTRRWPLFAPAAVRQGIHAAFAFPVSAGAVRLGILDVYRDYPGSLTSSELKDMLGYADAVLTLSIDAHLAVPDSLRYQEGGGVAERHMGVHQAAGMVSEQLEISVSDALVRLKAYAFMHERRLTDVAAEVINRRLRFTADGSGRSMLRPYQHPDKNLPPPADDGDPEIQR